MDAQPDGWLSLTDDEWARLDEDCRRACERQASHLPREARQALHEIWCNADMGAECACSIDDIRY